MIATRKAFGIALEKIGHTNEKLVVIDGDLKNSTYTELFAKAFPDRFFELYIAEQTMVGVGVGLWARGFHPVISTFACFLTRAADQLRMASITGVDMLVNGSHAGVSIGEDGPSQMGLEDLSLFRSLLGSTVFYPSDGVSTEKLSALALQQKGIVYIRTTRPETPILYQEADEFVVGGSRVFEPRDKPQVTVVAAGITVREALKAQQEVPIRVIDCYSIKPIDRATLKKAAEETKAIIVVEDHYAQGGLGDAVKSALADNPKVPIHHLAVTKKPRSGKAAELLAFEEIDAAAIAKKVQTVI